MKPRSVKRRADGSPRRAIGGQGPAIGGPRGASQQAPKGGMRAIPSAKDPTQSISNFLEARLNAALRSCTWRRGKVYLALFAGTDPVGKVVLAKGGGVVRFEIKLDARFDLENPEVQVIVQKWIRSGVVWAVWLGTHCQTWSLASFSKGPGWYNSYRTKAHPGGELGALSPKAKARVLSGNEHLRFSINILKQAASQGNVTAAMENPRCSVMWHAPEVKALQSTGNSKPGEIFTTSMDYCQYGAKWQKPTTILWVGVKHAMAPAKCCVRGRGGICARTGRPHAKLGQGRMDPKTGKRLTQLAEPYPPRLAKAFAECLAGEVLQ